MIRLLPLLACLFASCTSLDVKNGRYYTNADNLKVKIDARNGQITHYESESNLHSPVITAYTDGLGNLIMKGGAAIMMGKAPGAVTALVRK